MLRSKIALFLLISVSLLLSGCYTVNFKNGETARGGAIESHFHSNVLLSLVEISSPVNPKEFCAEKEWSMVTTQESFLSGILPTTTTILSKFFLPIGVSTGWIWDPQEVTTECSP